MLIYNLRLHFCRVGFISLSPLPPHPTLFFYARIFIRLPSITRRARICRLPAKGAEFAEDGIADFALHADPDEAETPKPIDNECDVGRYQCRNAGLEYG